MGSLSAPRRTNCRLTWSLVHCLLCMSPSAAKLVPCSEVEPVEPLSLHFLSFFQLRSEHAKNPVKLIQIDGVPAVKDLGCSILLFLLFSSGHKRLRRVECSRSEGVCARQNLGAKCLSDICVKLYRHDFVAFHLLNLLVLTPSRTEMSTSGSTSPLEKQ